MLKLMERKNSKTSKGPKSKVEVEVPFKTYNETEFTIKEVVKSVEKEIKFDRTQVAHVVPVIKF